jgi:hypothetical protein
MSAAELKTGESMVAAVLDEPSSTMPPSKTKRIGMISVGTVVDADPVKGLAPTIE